MRQLTARRRIFRWLIWSVGLILTYTIVACSPVNQLPVTTTTLNSRYTDEQPALSGNGRYVAFVTNRDGDRQLVMYDLQNRWFVDLPQLNQQGAIAENPSLSLTGRYIAYIATNQGQPKVALYDRAIKRSEILTMGYQGWVRNPSISPDGRYIVFETSRRGQWDIEVIDRGPNVELDIPEGYPALRS